MFALFTPTRNPFLTSDARYSPGITMRQMGDMQIHLSLLLTQGLEVLHSVVVIIHAICYKEDSNKSSCSDQLEEE